MFEKNFCLAVFALLLLCVTPLFGQQSEVQAQNASQTQDAVLIQSADQPQNVDQAQSQDTSQSMPVGRPVQEKKGVLSSAVSKAVNSKKNEPAVQKMLAIGYLPSANWVSGQFVRLTGYDKGLDIELDPNAFTSYEGGLWHKSGLKLGVSVDVDDNFVGKVNTLLGMLGYKQWFLRVSGGKLTGKATWEGAAVPGQDEKVKIDSKYTNVAIAHNNAAGTMYYGLSYTGYNMASELQTLKEGKNGDKRIAGMAYDPDAKFQIYGFLFGFDTLNQNLISGKKEGFEFWAYTQDTFGGGIMSLSSQGIKNLKAANPGYDLVGSQDIFIMNIQYDLTLGIAWYKNIKSSRIGLGLGYTFSGNVSFAFSENVSNTHEISPEAFPYLFYHGLVLKAAVRL